MVIYAGPRSGHAGRLAVCPPCSRREVRRLVVHPSDVLRGTYDHSGGTPAAFAAGASEGETLRLV